MSYINLIKEPKMYYTNELIRDISKELGITVSDTSIIVSKIFENVLNKLKDDHRVAIKNFGVFKIVKHSGNTPNGKRFENVISIKFRPSKNIKRELNEK